MWGGQAVAERAAQLMGSRCIGREDLIREAFKLDSSAEDHRAALHSDEHAWDKLASDRTTYVLTVTAALAGYAASNDLIYHGCAGHLLLKGIPAVLRVRVVAPKDVRIRVLMESRSVSREEAESFIKRIDESWARWTKFTYGVDWRDPLLYDLVINLEGVTVESACDCILHTAGRPEFTVTDEVRSKLADLALTCRAKLALAQNFVSQDLDLKVAARDGTIFIAAEKAQMAMPKAVLGQLEKSLAQIVTEVSGVKDVNIDLQVEDPAALPK